MSKTSMKNKIEIKRKKRKIKLTRRVKCHGNKEKCSEKLHPKRPKAENFVMTYKKVSWLKGLLSKIKSWINRIFR